MYQPPTYRAASTLHRVRKRFLQVLFLVQLLCLPGLVLAATKTVCDAGCDHTTIADAARNTSTGDTILVRTAKVYSESDIVVSGKNLVSEGGPEAFIINGAGCNNFVVTTGSGGTIEGFTITGCHKDNGSNGAGVTSNGDTLLNNVVIEGNSTTGGSAGLWHNGGGTLTIRNSEIRNNTSESMPAISSVAPYLRIFNLKVTGNTATGPLNTGTISIVRQIFSLGAHIDGLEISDNTANGRNIAGGGLYLSCSGGGRKVGIFNSVIRNNTATGTSDARGGGVYIASCDVDLVSTTISGNTLINTSEADSLGGGYYSASAGKYIRLYAGSSITGNTADSGGGVWCSLGDWQVAGTISGNTQKDTDFVDGQNQCRTPRELGTSQPESGTSGDPVNTFTGELFEYLKPDIFLGGPIPLEFSRFYNSSLDAEGYTGTLGLNWLHNFEFFLEFETDDFVKILTPAGRLIRFYPNADGKWVRLVPSQVNYQLVEVDGKLVLYDPETRYQYTFDGTSHQLTTISDANDNTLTLGYTDNKLTSVDDGLGRTLVLTYEGNLLKTVSGGGKQISFTHSSRSQLLTYVDALGHTTTYTYNTLTGARLATVTRPETNVPWTHSWDNNSRVWRQVDALGNTYQYSYGEGETTITDPAGNTTRHRHDASGSLTEAADEAGQTTTITPDEKGNRGGIVDQLGKSLTISHDPDSGFVTSIQDAEGNSFSYTYAVRTLANGIKEYDLTRADYPDGSHETWAYDDRGNVSQYTDHEGAVWAYTYNSQGNLLTETNPVGGVTTYTYLADGSLDTVEDPAGNLIDHSYDAERRLNSIGYPDGTNRQFTFDLADQRLTLTDENGAVRSRSFDTNGNLIANSDGADVNVSYDHDAMDRVATMTLPDGGDASISYDTHGRIRTMTGPDGNTLTWDYDDRGRISSLADSVGLIWSGNYDAAGRLLAIEDALGHTTSFVYDDADRPVQIINAEGTVQQLTYDNLDRLTAASAGGRTTTFAYDARGMPQAISINGSLSSAISYNEFGQPAQLTDAKGNLWTFGYDASGRTVSTTDPLTNTTFYGYDSRNRHNHTEFPDSMGTLDITHDGLGRTTGLSYSDGTALSYGYDALGSLTSATDLTLTRDALGRVLNSNGIVNTRDGAGRLDTTVLTGGTLQYGYDTRGQFTSLQDWLGGETMLTYDAAGRLMSINHANGLVTEYTYNAVNEVTAIAVKDGDATVSQLTLTRDALGQITSANRTQPEGTPSSRPASRRLTASFDDAMQHEAFSYDAMGRRNTDDRHTYTWNLASRVTGYSQESGSVTFGYDGLGNVISRTEGATTRTYGWNHGTDSPCIAEMTGATIRYNVCAPDGRLLYSITSAGERWHYHFDEMGNVHFVTDDNGDVLAVYRYSPFGLLLSDSSGGLDNPFTFQGRSGVLTEGNGLYLLRSRLYDSHTASFLSRDPVTGFDPATANPYQYALNNPLLYIDPDGGQSVKAEDVFSGTVGAFAALVDDVAGKVANKLDKLVAVVGKSSGPGKQLARNAANLRTQTSRLSKLGLAAWVYSAYQEIDSTNDKVKRSLTRQERQLMALLDAYVGKMNTVDEMYKQKKMSYHRWRAWRDLIEREYRDGVESTVRGTRLEMAQDSLEGALKAVGSVILPANATDAMMRWMGRNLPASETLTNTLTDWSAN
ncbi:MAG: DUF6531 domain-containing protein [Pseudomonadota bacterium]